MQTKTPDTARGILPTPRAIAANLMAAALPRLHRRLAGQTDPGGITAYQFELRGCGLHREHPLDFLVPSNRLWRLMYSNKCVPNRHRLGSYLRYAQEAGLRLVTLKRQHDLPEDRVEAIRPRLWRDFCNLSAEELSCMAFWIALEKPAAPALPGAEPHR